MFDQLKTLLVAKFPVAESDVSEHASLSEDLGLNSLEVVEFSEIVSDEIGVPITDDEMFELNHLDKIVALLESRKQADQSVAGQSA